MTSETRANIQEQIRLLIATEVEKERLRCIAIAIWASINCGGYETRC